MNRALSSKLFVVLLEIVVVLISFLVISSRFSPIVSSDDALSVLVTYDYDLFENFYTWGQNRGGTIVSFIGQLFFKGLGFSASLSDSLSRYLILILGYISYRRFFKSSLSILTLCVLFFLPTAYFVSFPKYSWGIMYSFVGLTYWALQKFRKHNHLPFKLSYALIVVFLSFICVWTMDQAIIALLFIGVMMTKSFPNKTKFVLVYAAMLALIIALISYLKSEAKIAYGYSYNIFEFNSLEEISLSLEAIIFTIINIISGNSPLEYTYFKLPTIHTIALLISIPFITFSAIKQKRNFFYYSLTYIVIIFVILLLSNWVHKNYESSRYFAGIYFVWGLTSIKIFELKSNNLYKIYLISTYLIGSATLIAYNLNANNWKFESRYEQIRELNSLGSSVGIIGSYWNSYLLMIADPDKIKATPAKEFEVKNRKMIRQVFNQKKLYLVKEGWLDEFPNETIQFRRNLIKVSEPFQIEDIILCEYEVIKSP